MTTSELIKARWLSPKPVRKLRNLETMTNSAKDYAHSKLETTVASTKPEIKANLATRHSKPEKEIVSQSQPKTPQVSIKPELNTNLAKAYNPCHVKLEMKTPEESTKFEINTGSWAVRVQNNAKTLKPEIRRKASAKTTFANCIFC